MQTKHILSAAVAVASLAGAAFAGTKAQIVQPTPVAPAECALSGEVYAGYVTNYTCRGIVASHALVEGDSVIPVGVALNYKLDDADAIVASIDYNILTSGHDLMGYDYSDIHNELDIKLGWENKNGLVDGLTTTAGWNLVYGGFLGCLANIKNAHSVTQEFYVNANYDINENWFAGITTSYAFQGVTGWWFQPYVGYKTAVCDCADVVVTAGMSATAGYFDALMPNANGAQAWWLQAEMPIKVGVENLTVSPFVSLNWAGCGALKENKGLDKGWKPYKNFGVVAGAKVSYSF